jgi:hypothetical protein
MRTKSTARSQLRLAAPTPRPSLLRRRRVGRLRSARRSAFLKRSDGRLFKLGFPGTTATQAFGVHNGDGVVGDYTDGSGNGATTHGFVWAPGFGFQTVNDPAGADATTINGVNDRGELVGFYTDSAGHTDGLLAIPQG